MIWWGSLPGRVKTERAAIAELADRASWLGDVRWKLGENARLTARFTITVEDRAHPMTMTYPVYFPDAPPIVVPVEDVRLSGHQYGAGGELCLEFRPDNWEPEITGAMMIESAYRLLAGEIAENGAGLVPDAHEITPEQDIRRSTLRFVLLDEAKAVLDGLLPTETVPISFVEHFYTGHWVAHLVKIGDRWEQVNPIVTAKLQTGLAVRLPGGMDLPATGGFDDLMSFLRAGDMQQISQLVAEERNDLFVVFVSDAGVTLLDFYKKDGEKLYRYRTVRAPASEHRLPEAYAQLKDKSVAVLGCGSLGSKIAVSLARSGVGEINLLDSDILLPGNLVRHDHDNRGVGIHKADVVKRRILEVAPSAKVYIQKALIGGQESAGSVDLALRIIGQCDIIIDATANPQVFNLCGAVARQESKPFMWAEVFAGGIGGLIVRCVPDKEPVPHIARRQVLAWFDHQGIPAPVRERRDYGAVGSDEQPFVADDGDVSVIAAHAARMAIDTLVRPRASIFPSPAYAIGLSPVWLFKAPFETYPIPLIREGTWGAEINEEAGQQLIELLKELQVGDGDSAG